MPSVPRKPGKKPARKPRQRDYKAEYRRRVAGTLPGTPERQARRGHRDEIAASSARRFLALLRRDDYIICPHRGVKPDRAGRFPEIWKQVIPDPSSGDGREPFEFTLRHLNRAQLRRLIAAEERVGVVFSPAPSLDQRRVEEDADQ